MPIINLKVNRLNLVDPLLNFKLTGKQIKIEFENE